MMKAGCCGRILACKPGYIALLPCGAPPVSILYKAGSERAVGD